MLEDRKGVGIDPALLAVGDADGSPRVDITTEDNKLNHHLPALRILLAFRKGPDYPIFIWVPNPNSGSTSPGV